MVVCFSHAENASMTSPFSDKLAVRLIGEGNHVSAKILVHGHRDFLHFGFSLKYFAECFGFGLSSGTERRAEQLSEIQSSPK